MTRKISGELLHHVLVLSCVWRFADGNHFGVRQQLVQIGRGPFEISLQQPIDLDGVQHPVLRPKSRWTVCRWAKMRESSTVPVLGSTLLTVKLSPLIGRVAPTLSSKRAATCAATSTSAGRVPRPPLWRTVSVFPAPCILPRAFAMAPDHGAAPGRPLEDAPGRLPGRLRLELLLGQNAGQ